MRRASLLCAAAGLAGCNALLGLDFDPRDPAPGLVDEAGTDEPPDSEVSRDGGSTDARTKPDGPLPTLLEEKVRLAALRTRVADAPALDGWLTTRSWLWKVKLEPAWDAQKLPGVETRQSAFPLVTANDTHVVTGRPVEDIVVRDATNAAVATYARTNPIPIALHGAVVFFVDGASGIDVLTWRGAAPGTRTKIGNVGAVSALPLGSDGDHTIWLRDVVDATKLWVVDLAKSPAVFSVPKTVQAQHATATDDGIVLSHVAGAEIFFQLLGPSGGIDLTAEIAAAACVVPASERAALQSMTVGYAGWLIYVSKGGLLAYRHADHALVPIQVRLDGDQWVHSTPRLLREPRLLAFVIPAVEQGLYTVSLDAVLPP